MNVSIAANRSVTVIGRMGLTSPGVPPTSCETGAGGLCIVETPRRGPHRFRDLGTDSIARRRPYIHQFRAGVAAIPAGWNDRRGLDVFRGILR